MPPRTRAGRTPRTVPGPVSGAVPGAVQRAAATFDVDDAYRDHAGALYGYALRAVGERAEAEDLVQEVFARAWRAAATFDPDRASVRTWLFAIARHLVLDVYRTRSRRPRTGGQPVGEPAAREPATPGPEDAVVERMRVVAALDRLTPEHREVVAAVHLDGRSYAELAAATGIATATLRTRMFYGLRAMRATLDESDASGRVDRGRDNHG